MHPLFPLLGFLAVAVAEPRKDFPDLEGAQLVDYINKLGKWKAALDPDFKVADLKAPGLPEVSNVESVKRFFLAKSSTPPQSLASGSIPIEFDSRTQWPECADVIGTIVDQASCGSCWAAASAAAITDRICIATKGRVKNRISAWNLLTCSGAGSCLSGSDWAVYAAWKQDGVVTGGTFEKPDGCLPYQFPPCKHYPFLYRNSTLPRCPPEYRTTPKCKAECQKGYGKDYEADKSYGLGFESPETVEEMQRAIMAGGPITAHFVIYKDFLHYYSGVYEHVAGVQHSAHAIRIIGWGRERGIPYWLAANSWNAHWGEAGLFRFRQLDNISERFASFSRPDLQRSFAGEYAHQS